MDEQARFVNKTTLNKDTCRDYLALTWTHNAGVLRWLMLGVAALALGYAGFLVWRLGPQGLLTAGLMLLLGAAAVYLAQWGWQMRLKNYTASQQHAWGADTLDKTVWFGEQDFCQASALGEPAFSYEKVDGLLEGKTSVVIKMGQHALLIKKDGFVGSTYPEFRAWFLQRSGLGENGRKRR